MRKRQSAPSRSCSTTNSRKNRAAVFIIGCCLCLAPPPLAAQPAPGGGLSAALDPEKNRLFLTAVYRLPLIRDILEPVESGLKSRAVFTLQLVEPRAGLFSFLGDVVLLEKTVTTVGYKDFYENEYVLEDEAGRTATFADWDGFAAAFASLSRYPLDEFVRRSEDTQRGFERNSQRPKGASSGFQRNAGTYLRLQAKVYPVQLIAPLTLIYLLSSSGVVESGWVKVELP